MIGERFFQFLETLLDTNAQQQIVIIFDNAPAHRRALDNQGPQFVDTPHQVQNLPPYSLFLNCCLVEQAISAYKAMLKRSLEEIRGQPLTAEHDQRMAHLARLLEQSIVTIARSMPHIGTG